jgi:hypothetical protein
MNQRAPWAWTAAGIVLDRELDGSLEQVWLSPDLPPERERLWHPLGVEFYCWFGDVDKLNAGLRALWEGFGRDSILIAVRRKGDSCRVLAYTAAPEAMVHHRYLAVRSVLRPTAMGLRLVRKPGRDAVAELLASLEPESESPVAPRAEGSDPPGAPP